MFLEDTCHLMSSKNTCPFGLPLASVKTHCAGQAHLNRSSVLLQSRRGRDFHSPAGSIGSTKEDKKHASTQSKA